MKPIARTSAILACILIASPLVAQVTFNPNPSRVVGHPRLLLSTAAPNLVEGREFYSPGGIAADTSVSPPILYVADTGNQRVLAWKNASSYANGARADLVIGQTDFYTTKFNSPDMNSGLSSPTGLAVDKSGNLYIADSGNNRVVRFPQPFSQPAGSLLPDLVIGQKTFGANSSNQAASKPSAASLSLNPSGTAYYSALAFDSNGHLFVSDAANNRVLRYNKTLLDLGSPGPAADVVLGQSTFDSSTLPFSASDGASRKLKNGVYQPSGLAFDTKDRLFVCDGLYRVLVYEAPYITGKAASRVMGVVTPASGQNYQISETGFYQSTTSAPPAGVFIIGALPFVVDTGNHRILRFKAYEEWVAEATSFSPAASGVLGQVDFASGSANRGQKDPAANTFAAPLAAVFAGNELYVVDNGNNRVLTFADPSTVTDPSTLSATRLLGQDYFQFGNYNLVEGREFNFGGYGGMAVDWTSNPPPLYVADTFNNRILAFRDVRIVKPGDKANLVIGQGDDAFKFYRTTINYPNEDSTLPSQTGLFRPLGLAVDAGGNLWVADGGNGRVLRFPRPFDKSTQAADIVLGQSGFTTKNQAVSPRTMSTPYGLAFSSQGSLLASDLAHNRVLVFQPDATKGLQSGQSATTVFGQADFFSGASGSANNRLNAPHHIAMDAGDRLYVCDSANNRLAIFGALYSQPATNASLGLQINVTAPNGIYVSPTTGEIWLTDPNNNRVLRFPDFDNLPTQNYTSNGGVISVSPLAVTQDPFGNVMVADAANRVAFYYPQLYVTNAANGLQRVAPGMIASIYPAGNTYGSQTMNYLDLPNPVPLATTMGDIQVRVNDVPAPLFFVSPGQINFQVPSSAPVSGTADFQVIRPSTGQVLADIPVTMDLASPGFFTDGNLTYGQASSLNQDNTRNSATNAIPRTQVIQLFLTGAGIVPNMPPDGTLPGAAFRTSINPRVVIGTTFVPDANIQYSGLAPGLVGVWQINVLVPDITSGVGSSVAIGVQYQDRSSLGYLGKPVTIAVK